MNPVWRTHRIEGAAATTPASAPPRNRRRPGSTVRRAAGLIVVLSLLFSEGSRAQAAEGKTLSFGEVETGWPGVLLQLVHLERLPGNRLLVGVRLLATGKVPRAGVMIAIEQPRPAKPAATERMAMRSLPEPFSLAAAEMIDELTAQTYRAVAPISHTQALYRRTAILDTLRPGRSAILSVQFPAPPVMPGAAGADRKVSFRFPNANGLIRGVSLPQPQSPSAAP